MQSIKRRVAALETNAIDARFKIIIVLDGETQADALSVWLASGCASLANDQQPGSTTVSG